MQNILVTDRYYPNDPRNPHEYDYIITDIGEGKVLNPDKEVIDLTKPRLSYGAVDFRAPEVHGQTGWSTKAEVFSFGVISCKILDCKSLAPMFPPDWVLSEVQEQHPGQAFSMDMIAHIVPAGLKKVIEACLSYSIEDRPSMRDTVLALDEVTSGFTSDSMKLNGKRKIRWMYWNWNESLTHGRKGTAKRDSDSRDTRSKKEEDLFHEFANPAQLD